MHTTITRLRNALFASLLVFGVAACADTETGAEGGAEDNSIMPIDDGGTGDFGTGTGSGVTDTMGAGTTGMDTTGMGTTGGTGTTTTP